LLIKPELSWYIDTDNNFIDNISNKRNRLNLKKMINNKNINCEYTNNIEDYIGFHKILSKNLNIKHKSNPTHNLDEFLLLKDLIKNNQLLYLVKENDNILGGVYVIKVTKQCWYTFYISINIDYYENTNTSIIYLMYTIANDAKKENVKYIDYGISTDNKGKNINIGLSDFKESSLGGISNSRYLFTL
jgi:hypothetical protein